VSIIVEESVIVALHYDKDANMGGVEIIGF
jgi:hypothetical protein